MALAETPSDKTHDSHKSDKKEKPSTKVVIRRLPPAISQEDFITQVSPVPEYDYIYTVKGDMSLGENAFSRVYINFCKAEDVYLFKEKFDNYVFVDAKGHEYPAVVEYASFQKVPKRRKPRPDPKIGSIESDPLYLEFMETLKEQPMTDEKPEYSYQPSNENKNDVTTPLLDYLKQRKIDRLRLREEKREERRKKEIERKKVREDDRKKRIEEKSTVKTKTVLKEAKDADVKVDSGKNKDDKVEKEVIKIEKDERKSEREERKTDKPAPYVKKERKYDDTKKLKSKYSKYEDKKEYKNKRDDYRDFHKSKTEEPKKTEHKDIQKKVKKYSERREERKNEASKAEKQNSETVNSEVKIEAQEKDVAVESKPEIREKKESWKSRNYDDSEKKFKNKENDPRTQRRIKNKDRPAMVLYKPGMLKKKSVDNDKDSEKDKSSGGDMD